LVPVLLHPCQQALELLLLLLLPQPPRMLLMVLSWG
jgi:hypothetical protein